MDLLIFTDMKRKAKKPKQVLNYHPDSDVTSN